MKQIIKLLLLSLCILLCGCSKLNNKQSDIDIFINENSYQDLDDTSICDNKDLGLKLYLSEVTTDSCCINYEIYSNQMSYFFAYPHEFSLYVYDNDKKDFVPMPSYACVDYVGPEVIDNNVYSEVKYFVSEFHSLKKGLYKIAVDVWYSDNKYDLEYLNFDYIKKATFEMQFKIKMKDKSINVIKYNDMGDEEYNALITSDPFLTSIMDIITSKDYITLPCDGIPNYKITFNNKTYYFDSSCKCIRDEALNLEAKLTDEETNELIDLINKANEIK